MGNKLIAWIKIQELHKHPTILFPFLLGTAIAWSGAGAGAIDWRVFAVSVVILLALIGIFLLRGFVVSL